MLPIDHDAFVHREESFPLQGERLEAAAFARALQRRLVGFEVEQCARVEVAGHGMFREKRRGGSYGGDELDQDELDEMWIGNTPGPQAQGTMVVRIERLVLWHLIRYQTGWRPCSTILRFR